MWVLFYISYACVFKLINKHGYYGTNELVHLWMNASISSLIAKTSWFIWFWNINIMFILLGRQIWTYIVIFNLTFSIQNLYHDAFAVVKLVQRLIHTIDMLNSSVPIKDERFLLRSPWETTAFVWIRLANLKSLKNVKLLFLLLVQQLTIRLKEKREKHPAPVILAGSMLTVNLLSLRKTKGLSLIFLYNNNSFDVCVQI